ncbi:MAG: hypothetical protein ACK2UU_18535 [Anaerolineae bacterium]
MSTNRSRSWFWQVVLFVALSLLFSALPFAVALLLDKSSLPLAILMAWYAAFPPLILLILAWLLYHNESSWAAVAGRLAVSVGIWFGLQALLSALVQVHIVVRLFALPATLAGGKGYLLGALLFLIGGAVLWIVGPRLGLKRPAQPSKAAFAASTAAFLSVAVLGLALLIVVTNVGSTALPAGGPALPSQDEVSGHTANVYNLNYGIRRPGWPAAEQARDYIVDQLGSFGFDDVNVEPYTFDFWREKDWRLTVDPSGEAWQPETYFYPYSGPTGPDGVEAELVYVGEPSEEAFAAAGVSGKIALVDLPATNISWDQMKLFTFLAYDPDNTAEGWSHPYPIGWPVLEASDLAEAHGAAGLVGILHEYPDMGTFSYYAPYDGELRPVPGLYLRDEDGQRLIDAIEAGTTRARLLLDAEVSMDGGTAWTVYGVLPGQRDDVVMVHTHYDAPWRSGIEDSVGVGMVLGLARYYAEMPVEQREHTMVFYFGGSHMIGAPANTAFMEAHADDIMSDLVVDIAIEHVADDYNPPDTLGEDVEPRGNFVYENPVLVSALAGSVASHGSHRTLLFPTGTPLGVPTDAGMFARSGYPVSSLISGPVWLFDDDDTLERVAYQELAPLSAMYIDFVGRLNRLADPLLRFNLNVWTLIVTAVVLVPLATISAANWPRREG